MDPRITSPGRERQLRAKLSPLMQAKAESQGDKVNACPFGCQVAQLDSNGYCRHLIGFSNDGRTYEPMIRGRRGRVVKVDLECPSCHLEITRADALKHARRLLADDGEDTDILDEVLSCPKCGPDVVLVPHLLPVQKSDQLIQITTSSRVYRNVDEKPAAKKAS